MEHHLHHPQPWRLRQRSLTPHAAATSDRFWPEPGISAPVSVATAPAVPLPTPRAADMRAWKRCFKRSAMLAERRCSSTAFRAKASVL